MEIIDLLNYAKRYGASDLHLTPMHKPCIRLHGEIQPITEKSIDGADIQSMLYSILTDAQRTLFERDLELDFAIQFGEDMRFRVNAFTTIKGPAIAFRSIPAQVLSLDQLALPKIFHKLGDLNKGLVLVTGPTGSGKSTTLAAIINEINKKYKKHILTIEDPIEFIHRPSSSIVNQRELHSNTKSFAAALRSALREDPDVILVGEMRDTETISLALTAAETGHLVLGTLHTTSAAKTVDRIIDVFEAGDKELVRSMLSSSIQAIIAQTLIKTKEGSGRVPAFEVLLGTPAVRNLIRENKIPQIGSMIQVGSKFGMISMKDYLQELIKENKISVDDAEQVLSLVTDTPDFEEATEVLSKVTNDKKSVLESGNYKNSFVKKVEDNF
jgi:twitching motility protein PilT